MRTIVIFITPLTVTVILQSYTKKITTITSATQILQKPMRLFFFTGHPLLIFYCVHFRLFAPFTLSRIIAYFPPFSKTIN